MLTERQICILKLLHQENEYLTISQIAAELFFSAKTVHNDLKEIKKHCQINQAGTVIARPGAGILLAIGGGSAIDTAKTIGAGVPYSGDVQDFYLDLIRPVFSIINPV